MMLSQSDIQYLFRPEQRVLDVAAYLCVEDALARGDEVGGGVDERLPHRITVHCSAIERLPDDVAASPCQARFAVEEVVEGGIGDAIHKLHRSRSGAVSKPIARSSA